MPPATFNFRATTCPRCGATVNANDPVDVQWHERCERAVGCIHYRSCDAYPDGWCLLTESANGCNDDPNDCVNYKEGEQ